MQLPLSSSVPAVSLEGTLREVNPPRPVNRLDPIAANLLAAARQQARVTVVTRTKERPLMLRRCMESVINQTFPDWLHVIVNDGGNPQVIALLVAEHASRYRGRVQVIHNAKSVGMQNASNIGVEAAAGEYLVIHDDDDSWQPEFLRACVTFLDAQGPASQVQGVVTQTARVLEEINVNGGIDELSREDYIPLKSVELFAASADNPFAPIAFVYRRAVHEQIGLFNEQFSVVGDWDFNLRFLAQYDIGVLEPRLANYHWRHRSGGSVYANTVTDALEVHHAKTSQMRNHYLRLDLKQGHLGLGYMLNTAHMVRGQSSLLWDVRNRSDQAIHEIWKVQNRLRHWEWLLTRNPELKPPAKEGAKTVKRAGGRKLLPLVLRRRRTDPAPDCRTELAALTSRDASGAARCRVLSVDVFDTALLRVTRQPIDVFQFMESAMRRQLGAPELPIAVLRVSAERTARRRQLEKAGHEEVTLEEIYDAFCELTEIDPAVHRAELMRLEIDAEESVLYANPPVLAACRAAARAGIRVVFASDMYLPRELILSLLRRNGYAVDAETKLFLSAERGASKHAGNLYDQMLEELGCAPGEIVHVGDNFHSDILQAKAKGLRSVYWQGAAAPDNLPLFDQLPPGGAATAFTDGDFLSSLCLGTVRRHRVLGAGAAVVPQAKEGTNGHAPASAGEIVPLPSPSLNGANGTNGSAAKGHRAPEDLWDRLGYEVGGPMYFVFLHWLLNQARTEGIERLYFLARDGYHLREACELLTAHDGFPVQSVYMAASRRLLNLPQITSLDQASMQFLLTPNPNLSVRHFLTRLGVDPAPLADKIRRAGFPSLDEVITTSGGIFRSEADHGAMRTLFQSLEKEVLRKAAEERERLHKYFDQIGFTAGANDKIAIVDVGWQASSVRALQTLLNLAPAAGELPKNGQHKTGERAAPGTATHRLRAFYFGTWHYARPAVEAGCRFSSFFFHLDKPHSRSHLVAESVELIELFFGAPNPTIIGLREGAGGHMETVHGECELGGELQARLTRMRNRAVDFVREMVALSPPPPAGGAGILEWQGPGLNYLEGVLERFLRRPTVDEARQLGALPARDSFGSASPTRPLAQPPGNWERFFNPQRLRHAYDHAFWKKGFLAQLPPRLAAKLRNLER